MKKSKWYAKALYLTLALALAIGLTPLAAVAGEAQIAIEGPDYTKVGEEETFTAITNPTIPGGAIDWEIDGTGAGSGPWKDVIFATPGTHVVEATGYWGPLEQTATHYIEVGEGLIPQQEYNIIGSYATFAVPDVYETHVKCWSFQPSVYLNGSWSRMAGGQPLCPDDTTPGDDSVTVLGTGWGELMIYAQTEAFDEGPPDYTWYNATTLDAIKKWGKIDTTWLTSDGETQVWWNENDKQWEGDAVLTETVIGNFITDGGLEYTHVAQGADVEWWIMDATAPVHDLPSDVTAAVLVPLIEEMQLDHPSRLVGFGDCDVKYIETVSGLDGTSDVTLVACGEESVKIVVVAKYPDELHYDQWPVFPEITSWNFWTQELEKVPQVRWAGEKIVLEKYFGTNYEGNDVSFKLENQSPGCLEAVYWNDWQDDAQTVWTTVQHDGTARCILTSEAPGEADTTCTLWSGHDLANGRAPSADNGYITNQHGFVVFFLKFEDITLGNVVGERDGHNTGLWTPENPWDTSTDVLTEMLNVSEDTLLRTRVRGWFMGDNLSWRPEALVDLDGDGFAETRLPLGRWVFPDDWPILAGPMWDEFRPHWDIMTQPNDNIMSVMDVDGDKVEELGDYVEWDLSGAVDVPGALVAEAPVIGPYNSLDDYTALVNTLLDRKTIVRNAKLNWWDCPMPPAKIIFKITEGPGFFKDADKGDIYYEWVDLSLDVPGDDGIAYTNPFYQTMIPANSFIPPFINNGGYDWDSWGWTTDTYGPYDFWEIINQVPGATPSDPQHPTKVEVYSDNHGEAMVWLNGDWNLDWDALSTAWGGVGIDIPTGEEVGDSTICAIADYPYLRKHLYVVSNDVEKTWTWGKDVRGADAHTYGGDYTEPDTRMVYDVVGADGDLKMAFIWVSDRDGFPAEGERIDWSLDAASLAVIYAYTGDLILNVPDFPGGQVTVAVTDGFLDDTSGVRTNSKEGVSYAKAATGSPELDLWADKYYPDLCNHAVAAIVVYASQPGLLDLTALLDEGDQIGTIMRDWYIDFSGPEGAMLGDANEDGEVNMGDVTTIERIILDLDAETVGADADGSGEIDMGDVTKAERIILGL